MKVLVHPIPWYRHGSYALLTMTAPPAPAAFGRLSGDVSRSAATIRRVEAETDARGAFTRLGIGIDVDTVEPHDQVRVSIFGPAGMHYDQLIDLPNLQHWFDLLEIAEHAGVPLPPGVTEPGTQVRIAPCTGGQAVQSRELLALQVTLDAPSGEGRYIFGHWAAEWPGSLWNSAFVSGVGGALHRAFAVATDDIYEHGVPWRVFAVGHADDPIHESYLGRDRAGIVWEAGGFVGIDLTPDMAHIEWSALHEAVLELDAIPVGEPEATPRRVHVPVTAR